MRTTTTPPGGPAMLGFVCLNLLVGGGLVLGVQLGRLIEAWGRYRRAGR